MILGVRTLDQQSTGRIGKGLHLQDAIGIKRDTKGRQLAVADLSVAGEVIAPCNHFILLVVSLG